MSNRDAHLIQHYDERKTMKMKMALAGTIFLGMISSALSADIEISNVSSEFEGTDELAIFMQINNASEYDDVLFSVKANIEADVEMETGATEGEHAEASGFEIAAGETLQLSDDGAHIALHEFPVAPKSGDVIELTLYFEEAGEMTVSVTVE